MRLLSLLLSTVLLGAPITYSELPAGRYSVKVSGMLTTTCSRAIEREMAKLPQVEAVSVDFDAESMQVTVRLDHTLAVSTLRRALHRAAKKVQLGADYVPGAISYLP